MLTKPNGPFLADELYLLAHDERGHARVLDRVVDLVLAAALLGELVLQNRVTVGRGQLVVVDAPSPDDAGAHIVLDQVVARREIRDLRVWLALLAGWSFEAVGERLERQDQVVRSKKRWGRPTRYLPVDLDTVAVRADLLVRRLYHQHPATTEQALLLCLAQAAGLTDVHFRDGPASTDEYLAAVVVSLPLPLHQLVCTLEDGVNAIGQSAQPWTSPRETYERRDHAFGGDLTGTPRETSRP